jgi:hypothetical protein
MAKRVFKVAVWRPETPRCFLILIAGRMQSLAHVAKGQPKEACRVMVAKVAAASKYREKCKKQKKSILTVNPEESLPSPPCVTV